MNEPMTDKRYEEIKTIWRCRGGSFPMPEETVSDAIDELFEEFEECKVEIKNLQLTTAADAALRAVYTNVYSGEAKRGADALQEKIVAYLRARAQTYDDQYACTLLGAHAEFIRMGAHEKDAG